MPRHHLRTYRRPEPAAERMADLERALGVEQRGPDESGPTRDRQSIDYRPIIAVVGLVIFGLAAIAFLLSLRMK